MNMLIKIPYYSKNTFMFKLIDKHNVTLTVHESLETCNIQVYK